jgi:hypothetical protein
MELTKPLWYGTQEELDAGASIIQSLHRQVTSIRGLCIGLLTASPLVSSMPDLSLVKTSMDGVRTVGRFVFSNFERSKKGQGIYV